MPDDVTPGQNCLRVGKVAAQQLAAALEGHQDLRLTRLACGKLVKPRPPGCARIEGTVPGAAGELPLASSGSHGDAPRCCAKLEAVGRRTSLSMKSFKMRKLRMEIGYMNCSKCGDRLSRVIRRGKISNNGTCGGFLVWLKQRRGWR